MIYSLFSFKISEILQIICILEVAFGSPTSTSIQILPEDVMQFSNQVAGRGSRMDQYVGVMKHKDGYILKPVTEDIYGSREVNFYNELENTENSVLKILKQLVPQSLGTGILELNGKSINCLRLEDITNSFKLPCVMDVKIGVQTWEPGASKEKILEQQSKYAACKKYWGFSITGYKFHDVQTEISEKYDRNTEISESKAIEAIYGFVNKDIGLKRGIVKNILNQLGRIHAWFMFQREFYFYASSILLAYDAEILKPHSSSSEIRLLQNSPEVFVYMIDFAHTLPNNDKKQDRNYINSLEKLINVFKNLSKLAEKYLPIT